MYEIVTAGIESKGGGKCEVCSGAGVEVEGQDGGWVGDNGFDFYGVDEGFCESGVLERGVIETVNIVPDWRN